MGRNISESINARLRNHAKATGDDMMAVQMRYVLERLLYRLTGTRWGDGIALKGALIFVAHEGDTHRPTSDIDINGYDPADGIETLEAMVRDAIALDVEDGVVFDAGSIMVRKERDGQVIRGGKVELWASLHTSKVRVRVDAGFGNAVTPEAKLAEYPSLLADMPRPVIRIYPFETMIAEKVHAAWRHGAETSRIRDYYDLYTLSDTKRFEGRVLADAITATFGCHDESPPEPGLDAYSDRFVDMHARAWDTYRNGKGLKYSPPDLLATVSRIRDFIEPAIALANGGTDPGTWEAGQGWSEMPTPGVRCP